MGFIVCCFCVATVRDVFVPDCRSKSHNNLGFAEIFKEYFSCKEHHMREFGTMRVVKMTKGRDAMKIRFDFIRETRSLTLQRAETANCAMTPDETKRRF